VEHRNDPNRSFAPGVKGNPNLLIIHGNQGMAEFGFALCCDDRSPRAFVMASAREAESAGGMTKVPQAW